MEVLLIVVAVFALPVLLTSAASIIGFALLTVRTLYLPALVIFTLYLFASN